MGNFWDKYVKGKVLPDVSALTADRSLVFPNSNVDLGKCTQLVYDTSWVLVSSFTNSWVNYEVTETNYFHAKYRKGPDGRVFLRGMIKNGTLTGSAFNLPSGFRPSKEIIFAVDSNGGHGRLNVLANGNVVPWSGSNAWFAIEVSFWPD